MLSLMFCIAAMSVSLAFMSRIATDRMDTLRAYTSYDLSINAQSQKQRNRLQEQSETNAFVYAVMPALFEGNPVTLRFLSPESPAFSRISLLTGSAGVCVPYTFGLRPKDMFTITTRSGEDKPGWCPSRKRFRWMGCSSRRQPVQPTDRGDAALRCITVHTFVSCWVVCQRNGGGGETAYRSMLPDGTEIMTYKESNSALYGALHLEQTVIRLLFSVLLVAVVLSVRRSTRDLIGCKRKEIGMLRTLGLRDNQVISLFLWEALWVSFLGIVLGWALSLLLVFLAPYLLRTITLGVYLFATDMRLTLPVGPMAIISLGVMAGVLLFTFAGTRRMLSLQIMEMVSDERF
jgi:hypothetical protein